MNSSTTYQREDRRSAKPHKRAPLDRAALDRLALAYVGRYATTRKKLSDYLLRKVRDCGWASDDPAPVEAIVSRLAELGYVNDEAFAKMRAEGLTRRGYGPQRVALALRHAGIAPEDSESAKQQSEADAEIAAHAFAKKRKIGPYAPHPITDPALQRKALAAMCRAGHSYEIARQILLEPVAGAWADDHRNR